MTLVQSEPKAIKIGTTDVKAVYLGENKVRPPYKPRTFTISRTEQSNMSSGWTYSDDAVGLTAGDTAFDEFFGYYGCRLNTSGVETAKVTQKESGGAGKLDITRLGTLTSGDNVMIAFPVMGIKMSKSGSTVTLSITQELNKDGYQYYAHSTGTLSNPGTPQDVFYLGAYGGYNNSNVLKSWSGKTPTTSVNQSNFVSYAKANGSGYNIIGFYQLEYINALYMMKYGNPNSESVIGWGRQGSIVNTGGTDSQTNASYGTTQGTSTQVRLFGVEDRWGNTAGLVGGICTNGSKNVYTALSGWNGTVSASSPFESTGVTANISGSGVISAIAGTNKGMFLPISKGPNYDFTTYYTDYVYVDSSSLSDAGGNYYTSSSTRTYIGAFRLGLYLPYYYTDGTTGTRLMYLNGLT